MCKHPANIGVKPQTKTLSSGVTRNGTCKSSLTIRLAGKHLQRFAFTQHLCTLRPSQPSQLHCHLFSRAHTRVRLDSNVGTANSIGYTLDKIRLNDDGQAWLCLEIVYLQIPWIMIIFNHFIFKRYPCFWKISHQS